MAVSATLHCLTGCALGEIAGMAVGTAIGLSNWGTVVLAVALAFLFVVLAFGFGSAVLVTEAL
jgi:hypothetical protein